MPISDKNLKHETILFAIALGLLADMDGGKELAQMLFENAFTLVEESDQDEAKKILKSIELGRGIPQDLGTQEVFQKLIADLSEKLKIAVRHYYDSDKTWSKRMRVRVTKV